MDFDGNIRNAIVRIKVVGIGGGGNSVLLRLAQDQLPGVELLAINTDAKQLGALQLAGVPTLQIGERLTKGRGTGGSAEIGEKSAVSDERRLQVALRDADLVFITAGMGGGVGTGAAPVVARCIRDMGILSIGVVTAPFSFEGRRKLRVAMDGIAKLQSQMDALVVIHNDNLMKMIDNRKMPLMEAFKLADGVLKQAISCISEVILTTGVVNVDFADINSIFRQSESSDAILGIGESETGSAVEAVKNAVASPLIERSLSGARGIILNVSGDETLSLFEVNEATQYIYDNTHPDVNIIFGTVIDKSLNGVVRATIVATDFVDSLIVRKPMLGQQLPETPQVAMQPAPADRNRIPTENTAAAMPAPQPTVREIPNVRPLPAVEGAEKLSLEQKKGAEDIKVPDFFNSKSSGGIPPFRPFGK